MNVGPVDDTVTVRKDMRNDATKWRFLTVVIGVSKPWQDATMELAAGNHMISAQKTPPT